MGTKIGILGSGMVGDALAKGFNKYDYEVRQGSRSEFADIASWADIIVLAVKGSVAINAIELANTQNFSGKTVIDATNPISDDPPENGVIKFFTDSNHSLMEMLQNKVPDAHFVKAFSSVGNALMVDPDFGDLKPSMFICGNNEQAKSQVTGLLNQFGWEVEDMGSATSARAIEPLCILWCIPGFLNNEWSHAFKLLKR